jgi:hypothetical protein
MAADRGVRIYVEGLGTPDGHAALGDGMAMYLQLDGEQARDRTVRAAGRAAAVLLAAGARLSAMWLGRVA